MEICSHTGEVRQCTSVGSRRGLHAGHLKDERKHQGLTWWYSELNSMLPLHSGCRLDPGWGTKIPCSMAKKKKENFLS